MLSACGNDSSGSGGQNYTGSKADINLAKNLVRDYSDSGIFFEKGWVSDDKVLDNIIEAETFAGYAQGYQDVPDSFYAMRHVGCITADGKELLTEQDKHTQMDVVIGESSTRATYIQQNRQSRCYLGQANWGHNISIFGIPIDSNQRKKGIFGLPSDICQGYEVSKAFIRIDKNRYKKNNNKRRDNRTKNDPYYYNASYRGDSNRWHPDRDLYYDVRNNRHSTYGSFNTSGEAEADSFGKIASGEAVFVSRTLRSSSTNPSCDKDVYWGFKINPQNPPRIQILGRNRSYSDI